MKAAVPLKAHSGMTLVEVMASVLLLTLLVGTVLTLLIQNMKMGETIDYNYAAVNIAKSRMDRIRELRRDYGFNNLYTATEAGTSVNRNGLPEAGGDFVRKTTITTGYNGNANLTKIEVSVSYKASGDVNITTIKLTSLISQYI